MVITFALSIILALTATIRDKINNQAILSALHPLLCNSTQPQYTLQMFADHFDQKTNHTMRNHLIRDCSNHKGSWYPIQTIINHCSSSSFLRVSTRHLAISSVSKRIPSTLNFHKSIGTDRTRTRNLTHPKRAPY